MWSLLELVHVWMLEAQGFHLESWAKKKKKTGRGETDRVGRMRENKVEYYWKVE